MVPDALNFLVSREHLVLPLLPAHAAHEEECGDEEKSEEDQGENDDHEVERVTAIAVAADNARGVSGNKVLDGRHCVGREGPEYYCKYPFAEVVEQGGGRERYSM